MVAATGQHHGKTTVTLGMVQALLSRGWKVAYQKPVGQQTVPVFDETLGKELEIDRDVDIFKFMWPELVGSYSDSSPVAFPPGFTRMVLDGKVHVRDLVSDCKTSFQRLLQASDYVVVEGTGHVGVGSIIDLNNAQVAAELGLDVVLVVPGGNPFSLMEQLRSPDGARVWALLRAKVMAGELVYISRSAGTIVTGANIDVTAEFDMTASQSVAGLDLQRGLVPRPHYRRAAEAPHKFREPGAPARRGATTSSSPTSRARTA